MVYFFSGILTLILLITGALFYIIKSNSEVSATEGEAVHERTFTRLGKNKIGQIAIFASETDLEILKRLEKFGVSEEPRDNMRRGNILVFEIAEVDNGADLNGDGDFSDEIVGWINLATGEVFSSNLTGRYPVILGNEMVFFTHEWQVNEDLNGDGDRQDAVMRFYNFVTNRVLNSRIPGDSEDISIDKDGFVNYRAIGGGTGRYKVPVALMSISVPTFVPESESADQDSLDAADNDQQIDASATTSINTGVENPDTGSEATTTSE